MSSSIEIHIATEFSKTPGARYKYEGPYSGELFLEVHLLPKFETAKTIGAKLKIYLDGGVLGYPSSFVSGSFGKLSIMFGAKLVLSIIELVSSNSLRVEKITREINNPKNR